MKLSSALVRVSFPWFVLLLGGFPSAAEELNLPDALSRAILNPHQTTVETRVYAGAKVPPVETFETAAEFTRYADRLRKEAIDGIILRGEARRWSDYKGHIEWLDVIEGSGYRIRKLRYEVIPGLWVPALLYEPRSLSGKVAAVLNLNGHEAEGIATSHIQERCINLAKRGLLALNVEWFGFGQLDTPGFGHYLINQLDLCGTSGVALHFLSQRRALDILLAQEHTDSNRVAVTGLSGGGWQTIFISALDTRVKLANPVAGYASFLTRAQFPRDLGDSEQTPSDLATVLDYTHLTAMLAPRPLLLTNNSEDDCCFRTDDTLPALLSPARGVYRLFGAQDRLLYHINFDPGTHNYLRDNRQAFYTFLRDFFFPGDPDFPTADIASEKEVRAAQLLHVPMPDDNLDFQKIALHLSQGLPRQGALSSDKTVAVAWQEAARARLGQIVRATDFHIRAERAGEAVLREPDGVRVSFWRLALDGAWTVPVVEMTPRNAESTVVVLADAGRKSLSLEVERLLGQRRRVVALDPFYFGESHIDDRDYLFALLLATVGQRPLGVQASQVVAVSRWLAQRNGGSVSLYAHGPRTSLIATVAAALEPKAIADLSLNGSFGSLREIVEEKTGADQAPELFCFGLLEQFDIRQLLALVAPRQTNVVAPSRRAMSELKGLAAFYRTLGVDFDPLAAVPAAK